MRIGLAIAAFLLSTAAMAGPSTPPLIIAHRGASAERPEHSLMAYRLAIQQGADMIEPDLVMTSDGHLVARHENEISGTTDVAARPEFAGRKRTQTIDGETVTGWFTEDFTLAELKSLFVRERLPQLRPANSEFDGQERIPTLAEIIALVQAESARLGRVIGLYPETKHPGHFRAIGLPLEAALLAQLEAAGWRDKRDPVFIQSFEAGNLQALRPLTRLRLVQLVASAGGPADRPGTSYAMMLTDAGLRDIASYADAIGAEKALVIPRDAGDRLLPPTDLVARAHRAGLQVHLWTFRPENAFLPLDFRGGGDRAARGDAVGEIRAYLATGIDGLFSDSVVDAVKAISPAQ